MRSVLFVIPLPGLPFRAFGYGLMLCLAFLAAMSLAARQARRLRLDPESIYDMALWLLLGGLIGARGFYVWQYWGTRVTSLADVFRIWEGGIVLYGSLLGAAAGLALYRWRRPFPVLPTLDALAPAIALGVAIGRLGCFLNGCCYGDRCDLPWAVTFPGPRVGVPGDPSLRLPGSAPWADHVRQGLIPDTAARSLPVHPTQLYSTLDGLILMAVLLAFTPVRRRDGQVMALLLTLYPITRFLIESLRNDEPAFFAGLTISQNISVVLLLGGLAFWAWLGTRPPGRFEDTAPPPGASGDPNVRENLA